ncbi:MAG: phage portal protein [Paenibacillaceae bacterium]|jgi:uncharacterized protein YmfQ (DUF2313 family)|nr:phage portal protein [Paenibacillaceae bacterium]
MNMREQVKSYISPLYAADWTTGSLLDAGADGMGQFEADIADVLNQFFVDTATWGLADWEEYIGIPTDLSKNFTDRRAMLRSLIRGSGTITASLLENVAEAYDNGRIEVTEQPGIYQLTVRFADTVGLPPNLDDLKRAIEAVKPAHLSVVYEYKYLLLNQVHGVMTINELEQRRLYDFAPFMIG